MRGGTTDYIQNEGLNLSVEHRFSMQMDGEKDKLTCEDAGGYDLYQYQSIGGKRLAAFVFAGFQLFTSTCQRDLKAGKSRAGLQ